VANGGLNPHEVDIETLGARYADLTEEQRCTYIERVKQKLYKLRICGAGAARIQLDTVYLRIGKDDLINGYIVKLLKYLPRPTRLTWLYQGYCWHVIDTWRKLSREPVFDAESLAECGDEEEEGGGEQHKRKVAATCATQDFDAAFRKVGLTADGIKGAARRFLHDAEPWVHLYLVKHACVERDDIDWQAVDNLGKDYEIPSHHRKAAMLGITPDVSDTYGFKDYRQTILGRWLMSLGIEEWDETTLLVLKLLCEEALLLAVEPQKEE